jgi:hypothetical protein
MKGGENLKKLLVIAMLVSIVAMGFANPFEGSTDKYGLREDLASGWVSSIDLGQVQTDLIAGVTDNAAVILGILSLTIGMPLIIKIVKRLMKG